MEAQTEAWRHGSMTKTDLAGEEASNVLSVD